MKHSIDFTAYSTVNQNFSHFSLIPHPFLTYQVVNGRIFGRRIVIGINFIFFEVALILQEKLDNVTMGGKIVEVTGDEPFESQVTSVPEKTINDLNN